jgi:hypothetical protein
MILNAPLDTRPQVNLATVAVALPFVVFLAVYAAAAGHGFVKDDVVWILGSRIGSLGDLVQQFRTNNGFYRPVVSLTFGLDQWVFGVHPLGYGITNVFLALLCGLGVARLARASRLPRGAAVLASALWLLNLQGIRMAVLWISGRTALLLTLAATESAVALLKGRVWPAGVWLCIALFSKEEAVAIPAIFLAWLVIDKKWNSAPATKITTWLLVACFSEGLYFVARTTTTAMTPWSAPWYYTPTFSPAALLQNVAQYADKVGTLPVGVVLIAWLILRPSAPVLNRELLTQLMRGAAWLVGGFAATIFLPVRSDLYACFPSVGVCIAAAALSARLWQSCASPARQTQTLVVAILLVTVLAPVYWYRTIRWSSLAEFSTSSLADLTALAAPLPAGATILIDDDRSQRVNLSSTFGTLLPEAYLLVAGRNMNIWVGPPDGDAPPGGFNRPCQTCVDLHLKVSGRRLVSAASR